MPFSRVVIAVLAAGALVAVHEGARADVADDPLQDRRVRILPLGDSITYGTSAEEHAGYRLPLARLLDDLGLPYRFVGTHRALHAADRTGLPHNAYRGRTIREIHEALRAERVFARLVAAGEAADVVLLHAGTNNVSTRAPIEAALEELRALLGYLGAQRGIGLAEHATVLVAKIIPHTRGRDGAFDLHFVTRARAFNAALDDLVNEEFGDFVRVVDMFDIPIANLALDRLGIQAASLDLNGNGHVNWFHERVLADGGAEVPLPLRGTWYINRLVMTELRDGDGRTLYDGIHPTALGYEVMAHQWLSHLRALVWRESISP